MITKDKQKNHTALIIMDGWGIAIDKSRSAIDFANTPCIDKLYKTVPNSTLVTYGNEVGLPKEQMGNSEVGHLNLGAGRVVFQELLRINNAIESGLFKENTVLIDTIRYCKEHKKPLHLMGLVSDGGVHSHINHLKEMIQIAEKKGLKEVYIHAFMDGRDCDPDSGLMHIENLQKFIESKHTKIASVIGRYYAMDRDKRWERIQKAYNLLVFGEGNQYLSPYTAIKDSYNQNIMDEFILPSVITTKTGTPLATIKPNDAVICFNFRTDRCREIIQVLTQEDFVDYKMKKLPLHLTTMTRYDERFKSVKVLFEQEILHNTLGEILEKNGKTQLRIAETEKYPHVSFFFSGGREEEFKGEQRLIVPSPKVATYNLKPEMSAFEVCNKAIEIIKTETPDFICLNFANTDMVGHTGNFNAAMKAAEAVDECVSKLLDILKENAYEILLTADHGNADIMKHEDGSPHTAHTKNLVPLFYIGSRKEVKLSHGKLSDIAPTILQLMEINIPKEMTGNVLISD